MIRVPLSNSDKVAIVDDGWEEDVLSQTWHLMGTGYAYTLTEAGFPEYKTIYLHKLIMGENPGFEIDHINGNRLDNRTANLRFVTPHQQCMNKKLSRKNRTGHKGVMYFDKPNWTKKWAAYISRDGQSRWIGYYKTFEEACQAREQTERELYGEYARKEPSNVGHQKISA